MNYKTKEHQKKLNNIFCQFSLEVFAQNQFSFQRGQASFGEYPWQAAILKRSGGDMVYVCGATLVSDQYLMTAAHCVKE